jgi:hypothetical protein
VTESFENPEKSARTGRLGAIGAKNECFRREQNGVQKNLFSSAGFPKFTVYTLPESPDVLSIK